MARRPAAVPTRLGEHLDAVLIGGREAIAIEIAEYDPGWPAHRLDGCSRARRPGVSMYFISHPPWP
jgi:hypothetical protein